VNSRRPGDGVGGCEVRCELLETVFGTLHYICVGIPVVYRSNGGLYTRNGNIDLQVGQAELELLAPECGEAPLWDEVREMSEVLGAGRSLRRDLTGVGDGTRKDVRAPSRNVV
jgi:hypothetical protein